MISPQRNMPYPVKLSHRALANEAPPPLAEVVFDEPLALSINRARLDHLTWMDLDVDGKRVLDLGGGPGHLAQYFRGRGCIVTHTDGRLANVERARQVYPGIDSRVIDVEDRSEMGTLGKYDVVFSYGLLYHLENPVLALRNIGGSCSGLLLLETIICDTVLPFMRLEDEPVLPNQALHGIAVRLSPSAIVLTLDRVGMPYVYAPTQPPSHADFEFSWLNNGECARNGNNLRCIFVGSRQPLENPHLTSLVATA